MPSNWITDFDFFDEEMRQLMLLIVWVACVIDRALDLSQFGFDFRIHELNAGVQRAKNQEVHIARSEFRTGEVLAKYGSCRPCNSTNACLAKHGEIGRILRFSKEEIWKQ